MKLLQQIKLRKIVHKILTDPRYSKKAKVARGECLTTDCIADGTK